VCAVSAWDETAPILPLASTLTLPTLYAQSTFKDIPRFGRRGGGCNGATGRGGPEDRLHPANSAMTKLR